MPRHTIASIPLLETKFYIPQWHPGLVSRPRLIDCLNQGSDTGYAQAHQRKLTLVSAPAGFGKTTLLAEWVAAVPVSERPIAWLSLDQADNDPTFFWTYIIAALQRIQSPTIPSNLGETALSLLHSLQPPPIEAVLASLINEINTIKDNVVLILDDYHVVEVQSIHGAIAWLLDHLPTQMHLIIASRSDPPLPLARLRVRRELTELRVAELRFTPDEATAFFNEVMELAISAADIATVEKRTEGWIAGLQLAALSMQGHEDVPGFVAAFSGNDRYIVDYLVEEVLQRQPEHVRRFLLQTSILDRLSAPLCDAVTNRSEAAVTDQHSGKRMLEGLERGNLFVVPLDNKRQWYRYHHLFAEVLYAHSMEEQPDRIPTLHRRASEWYETNDLLSDAIRHALAARDVERAAGLIELAWPAMRRTRQEATMLRWIKTLPDSLFRSRPVLSVVYAWVLLNDNQLEAAEARLQDAERWLNTGIDGANAETGTEKKHTIAHHESLAQKIVVDNAQFRSLPAAIANARAYRAQALGDIPGTIAYTRQALNLLPEDDYYERGTTSALLGIAYWASGHLEAAHQSFAEGLASLQMGGGILIRIGGTFILANIRRAQGRLREAIRAYEQSLQLATEKGTLKGTAELYLGLSELHHEQGNLSASKQHLLKGKALLKHASLPGYEYMWCTAQARMKQSQGDLDGALNQLQEAERLFYESPIPDVRPISALKARVWVAQSRLVEAQSWVREHNLSVDDALSYLREYEHVTLAKILIAQYKRDRTDSVIHQAIDLLTRLLQAAEAGERTGSVIEILVVQAIAHAAHTNIPLAIESLERALNLAEPEGYVRLFVDEGESMRNLLRQAALVGIGGSYTQRLLSAFNSAFNDEPTPPVSTPTQVAKLVEPLTAREIEILRLIAVGLRNQEIADQLFISLATVKRHIANLYGKLGVSHRTEAVARANELNLL